MIYYITTYDKNRHAAQIIKSHFDNTSVSYFFVYGKGCINPLEPYIEVDCEECYEQLPLKTFLILEHFLKSGHTHMSKVDDDTLIDIEKSKTIITTEDYVGIFETPDNTIKNRIFHWFKIQNPLFKVPKKVTSNISYAQGACYFLSRHAAEIAYNKGREFYVNTPQSYLGEDVKIGMALTDERVIKKDIKSKESLLYEIAENFLFIHPVHFLIYNKLDLASAEEKLLLLKKYNSLNANCKREVYLTNIIKSLSSESIIINNNMPS